MLEQPKNIVVFGSSGSIGSAFVRKLTLQYPGAHIHPFSRQGRFEIEYSKESSIAEAAKRVSESGPLDLGIVSIGALHDQHVVPEKSLKSLSSKNFHHLFEINTVIPALLSKYFLPLLNKAQPSIFAILSARVGSISDNRLGGWYAYRASKAALNMVIKNAAIEIARVNRKGIVVGLHPGTVDSDLSKPFQSRIPINQLVTSDESVDNMLQVLATLGLSDSGRCYAWDGEEIFP